MVYLIKKGNFSTSEKGEICDYIDMGNGYYPKVEFKIVYKETGFSIKFFVYEKNPKATFTEHFSYVHLDSCVEWFVNFAPDINDRYFNFEVNANGAMNVAFNKARGISTPVTKHDIATLNIKARQYDDMWTVKYTVPFVLIKKFIPKYDFQNNKILLANVYKCGDETEYRHYGCLNMVNIDNPDFHQPCYFREMKII